MKITNRIKKLLLAAAVIAVPLSAKVNEDVVVPYVAFPIKMGKGFDVVQAQCLTCHSFGYMINQGPQSRTFWKEKVEKMIVHFKADMITEKDAEIITDYFFEQYGNGKLK
ncbi:sulfite:cytochrome C oxidoreductase subunit B [Sulfurovum sp.]|jgi:mono/diheme cytochrome c family protein|uniref:sulfite:cytochrome C oxidoreductase subunit B n=1 Tax=Sulfurovum sp. TaxID=1969726 RepID=UPI002A360B12|nr:sulfite:cytochrome C oxidoreductase subunit B [Sulfurovum sp.]MDY0402171.1 sulfite:cytochrome C oxidoreductase subunit B [Sulfurovum sp.]